MRLPIMKSSIALCFRVKETQKFEYISRKYIIGLKKLPFKANTSCRRCKLITYWKSRQQTLHNNNFRVARARCLNTVVDKSLT